MNCYKLDIEKDVVGLIEEYHFVSEEKGKMCLQHILAKNPQMITELPELEIINTNVMISCREYSTNSRSIDILMITDKGDIIIVETKLIRNPEATRIVVAQVIDYAKALSNDTIDEMIKKFSDKFQVENLVKELQCVEKLKNDDYLCSLINTNLKTGNYKIIIVGDAIHPNVIGMIESIQSAPHLAFTLYLVELNVAKYDSNTIIICPKVVSNTFEIERSVIKIEINSKGDQYKIESGIPSIDSKGSRPILSWERYLDSIENNNIRSIIQEFKHKWISEIDDSINMGQVGFSAGMNYGNKRIPIQFVYNDRIAIISEKQVQNYNIPDYLYAGYKDKLKKSPLVYDKYLIGNRVEIPFKELNNETLQLILDAAIEMAEKMKNR